MGIAVAVGGSVGVGVVVGVVVGVGADVGVGTDAAAGTGAGICVAGTSGAKQVVEAKVRSARLQQAVSMFCN